MTTTFDDYKIIIPLDVILDTHMGTAALINPKAPLEIIENNYVKRESNDLWRLTEYFSREEFIDRYNKRDITTLKASILSNISKYILNMIQAKLAESTDRGGDLRVTVIINGFPYVINKELETYLCAVVHRLFLALVSVELRDLTMEDLTVGYLKNNNILSVFLNDFNDWIKIHFDELEKNPYPRLEIYAPMFCNDLKSKLENSIANGEIDEELVKEMSPFRATEIALARHVSVNYLPAEFFSIPIF